MTQKVDALFRKHDRIEIEIKPISNRAKEWFGTHQFSETKGWVGFTELVLPVFRSMGWSFLEIHKKKAGQEQRS